MDEADIGEGGYRGYRWVIKAGGSAEQGSAKQRL